FATDAAAQPARKCRRRRRRMFLRSWCKLRPERDVEWAVATTRPAKPGLRASAATLPLGQAGSVAAGPRQTLNKSGAYGVRHYDKDNWNGASSFQHHLCRGAATSQNDVWGKRDQFRRIFARFSFIAFPPTCLELHIAPWRPTQLLKRFQKCRVAFLSAGRVFCDWLQDSDTTHRLALLCARLKRPRRCRAAYQPNEIAPSHCGPRGFGQGIVAVQLEAVKGCPMSALGRIRSFGDVGSMSGLPESRHGWRCMSSRPNSSCAPPGY